MESGSYLRAWAKRPVHQIGMDSAATSSWLIEQAEASNIRGFLFLISQDAWRKVVGSTGPAIHLCQALSFCSAIFGLLAFVCLKVTSWSLQLQIMYCICLKGRIDKGEAAWHSHLSFFILSLSAGLCLQQKWFYAVSHEGSWDGGWESKYFTWGSWLTKRYWMFCYQGTRWHSIWSRYQTVLVTDTHHKRMICQKGIRGYGRDDE